MEEKRKPVVPIIDEPIPLPPESQRKKKKVTGSNFR